MYWVETYFKLKVLVPLVIVGLVALVACGVAIWDWAEARRGCKPRE